ncbi:MAG TPA: hypothetical protein VLE72_01920 [Candidatus Saccharimonadales bacterium]|nr:hypothetical protein [Candidatus Saccharimonadales bacterium]
MNHRGKVVRNLLLLTATGLFLLFIFVAIALLDWWVVGFYNGPTTNSQWILVILVVINSVVVGGVAALVADRKQT